MSAAHTPGPWSQDKYGGVVTHSGRMLVAEGVALGGRSTEETRANARLIAAAPELLEALNNILVGMEASGGWEGDDELFNAGVAAYKKATGEPA
ncbi:MAG: hypothetical protein Q7T46_11630 [Polaromonas sp.]|nr:hypothetical protein [Polaromonas sp.]